MKRVVFALVWSGLLACGSSQGPASVDAYVEEKATIECEWFTRCCPEHQVASLTACVKNVMSGPDQALVARVESGTATYHADAAALCLADLRTRTMSCAQGYDEPFKAAADCPLAIVPALSIGADCSTSDVDCTNGGYCKSDSATSKVCAVTAPIGGSCRDCTSGPCIYATCVTDAWCDYTGTCAALKPNGVSCSGDAECASGSCNGTCEVAAFPLLITLCFPIPA